MKGCNGKGVGKQGGPKKEFVLLVWAIGKNGWMSRVKRMNLDSKWRAVGS